MKRYFPVVLLFCLLMAMTGCGSQIPPTDLHTHEHDVTPSAATEAPHVHNEESIPTGGGQIISGQADPFQLGVLSIILETAGFEIIADQVSQNNSVEPGQLAVFVRVRKLILNTTWPPELQGQAQGMLSILDDFIASAEAAEMNHTAEHLEEFMTSEHGLAHETGHFLESASTSSEQPSAFNISVAQYLLDSSGFHEMTVTLGQQKVIQPEYRTKVQNIQWLLNLTVWPAELSEQANAFTMTLEGFKSLLDEENIEAAITTAQEVHEQQHDLSHEISHWLEHADKNQTESNSFELSLAQYEMDMAGFHEISSAIVKNKSIEPGYFPVTHGAWSILSQVGWPAAVKEMADPFVASLADFASALESGDVDRAVELADGIHDGQHELSGVIDEFLESRVH